MRKTALVVGDVLADHLLPALLSELEAAGWQVVLLDAHGLSDARVSATETGVWVDDVPVDAVAFRLSLELLVAPAFVEGDRAFVANELRAFWTHVLCLPTVRALNDGYASSLLLRDPCAWRDLLRDHNLDVVPARFGSIATQSWWLRPSGGLSPPPSALVAQTLGALSVQATEITSVLCCGGCVQDDDKALRPAAERLGAAGLGLAELLVDQHDRLLTVVPEPAISPAVAPWASQMLVRWLDAPAGR